MSINLKLLQQIRLLIKDLAGPDLARYPMVTAWVKDRNFNLSWGYAAVQVQYRMPMALVDSPVITIPVESLKESAVWDMSAGFMRDPAADSWQWSVVGQADVDNPMRDLDQHYLPRKSVSWRAMAPAQSDCIATTRRLGYFWITPQGTYSTDGVQAVLSDALRLPDHLPDYPVVALPSRYAKGMDRLGNMSNGRIAYAIHDRHLVVEPKLAIDAQLQVWRALETGDHHDGVVHSVKRQMSRSPDLDLDPAAFFKALYEASKDSDPVEITWVDDRLQLKPTKVHQEPIAVPVTGSGSGCTALSASRALGTLEGFPSADVLSVCLGTRSAPTVFMAGQNRYMLAPVVTSRK